MSEAVIFQNEGLIDLRAIQFMGLNAKKDSSAIGFFGTGLKYAIAVLLRERQSITIYLGEKPYEFTVQPDTVRGKDFGFIYMNDQPLGITTELGKNWEMWQAFRELYSNMLDEDGKCYIGVPELGATKTTIVVRGTKFALTYHQRDEIILNPAIKPIAKNDGVSIYAKARANVFYRGIRANKLNYPPRFTYNYTGSAAGLTEDRTINSLFDMAQQVALLLYESTDEFLLRQIVGAPEGTFEHQLDLNWAADPGETFLKIVREVGPRGNRSAWNKYLNSLPEGAQYEIVEPSPHLLKVLERAKAAIRPLGYTDDYPIRFVKDLGENVLGEAKGRTIYLTLRVLEMGTKQVASTLYEEWVHCEHRYMDCSREMQNFLFDKVITLVEQLNNDPL